MKVFTIIVTYNGKQWYKSCFDSLKQSKYSLNVVIVDNASTDDTVEFVKKNYPEFTLIESNKNLGFGGANNIGLKYVLEQDADYVFLLNQDTCIESNVISNLVEIHQQNSDYGILSPMHINVAKNKIERDVVDYVTDLKNISIDFISDLYFKCLKDVYDIKFINAAAWLLPIDIVKKVGGFDPIFFHYGEDDNYIDRVHYHGLKVGICPNLRIVHDTENRNEIPNENKQSVYKRLLVRWTNINQPFNARKLTFFYRRKILKFCLKFDKKECIYYHSILDYLLKMKKNIDVSRSQNVKKASSWL